MLYWNIEGLNSKDFTFYQFIAKTNADCVIFTETWHISDPNSILQSFLPMYDFFSYPGVKTSTKGRAKGGIVIGLKKSRKSQLAVVSIQHNIAKISTRFGNTTSNIYASYIAPGAEGDTMFNNFVNEIKCVNPGFVVIGDLNCRIGNFNHPLAEELGTLSRNSKDSQLNARGKQLVNLAVSRDWYFANGTRKSDYHGEFTFCNNNGCSVIDICFGDSEGDKIIKDFEVLPASSSCHCPIIATLGSHLNYPCKEKITYHKIKRIKWAPEKLTEFLSTYNSVQQANNQLRHSWRNIRNAIDEAARKCEMVTYSSIPRRHRIHNAVWFDEECRLAQENVAFAARSLRKAQPDHFLPHLQQLQETRALYNKIKKQKKKQHMLQSLQSILHPNKPSDFWNGINRLRRRPNEETPPIPKAAWQNHYQNLFRKTPENHITFNSQSQSNSEIDAPFTIIELRAAIKKLKNKKSPGLDGYPNEVWKAISLSSPHDLLDLFNEVLHSGKVPEDWCTILISPIFKKGDKCDPSNYRPISLVATILKLLTAMLADRLQRWASSQNLVAEYQAGFKKGIGTMEQVFGLLTLIQSRLKNKNGKLYAVFVDAKAAFDNVWHGKLWSTLYRMGLGSKTLSLLRRIYFLANGKIKTSEGLSDPFKFHRGVLQGESASPQLFNLYIDGLIHDLYASGIPGVSLGSSNIHVLLFADDIVLLANTPDQLQKKIDVLSNSFKELGIQINISKTKVMVFTKQTTTRHTYQFKWGEESLEIVNEYIYLGVQFTSRGKIEDTAERFLNKAKSAVAQIFDIGKRARIPPITMHEKLFASLAKSTLLYCSPLWAQKQQVLDKIEQIQVQYFKTLLGLPKCTPGYFVRLETGSVRIAAQIFKATLKFLLKLLQKDEDSFLGQAIRWQLRWSNRNSESVRKNWYFLVKQNLSRVISYQSSNLNDLKEELQKNLNYWCDKYRLHLINEDVLSMRKSTFIPWYVEMKTHATPEPYLHQNLPLAVVRSIAQARAGLFRVKIDQRRIPLNKKCDLCGVENDCPVNHLLFHCRHTRDVKRNWFPDCDSFFEFYKCNKLGKKLKILLPALIQISSIFDLIV